MKVIWKKKRDESIPGIMYYLLSLIYIPYDIVESGFNSFYSFAKHNLKKNLAVFLLLFYATSS